FECVAQVLVDGWLRAGVAWIKRLAAGKTFVLAVPEADAIFAQPPAEVDFLIVDQCRKIEQAHFQVFHYATRGLDPLERSLDGGGQVVSLESQLGGLLIG